MVNLKRIWVTQNMITKIKILATAVMVTARKLCIPVMVICDIV